MNREQRRIRDISDQHLDSSAHLLAALSDDMAGPVLVMGVA